MGIIGLEVWNDFGNLESAVSVYADTTQYQRVGRRDGLINFAAKVVDFEEESFHEKIRCFLEVNFTFPFFSNPTLWLSGCEGERLDKNTLRDHLDGYFIFFFLRDLGVVIPE